MDATEYSYLRLFGWVLGVLLVVVLHQIWCFEV